MNESTGGSLLLSLVVIVVGTMIAIFTASFAYTKAYRAKSIIIKDIEDNNGSFNVNNIDEQLTNMGYRKGTHNCTNKENKTLVFPNDTNLVIVFIVLLKQMKKVIQAFIMKFKHICILIFH